MAGVDCKVGDIGGESCKLDSGTARSCAEREQSEVS